MTDRPTPAEAMALWYSLARPSGAEVAARFTAAGRPISSRTITRWKKHGWLGVPNAPRTERPTPAEAQAVWDSLEQPSLHKVANAFKARGRPVGHATIGNWRQAGWSGVTARNAVAKANRAVEKIAAALPALTGDATSTLSDFLSGSDIVPDERRNDAHDDDKRRNDARSKAEIAEDALLKAMRTAAAVNDAIYDIATAVPKADAPVSADAPPPMLLRQSDGIAKLFMASNAGISVTMAGMRQLPVMRAEEAAEAPGTQTLNPPGDGRKLQAALDDFMVTLKQDRQAAAARAIAAVVPDTPAVHRPGESPQAAEPGTGGEKDSLCSSTEAIDDELKAIIAGKHDDQA
jgi:hypothetical protein